MKDKVKKILLIVIGICLLLSLKISTKIIINNRFIANYPDVDQEYRLILLSIFNYYEPYIAPYNYGNYLYQKERYEEAYKKYQKALEYEIPNNRICSVRINISLVLAKMSENENNAEALKLLSEAQKHLEVCLSLNSIGKDQDRQQNENNQEQNQKEQQNENSKDNEDISKQQEKALNLSNEIGQQMEKMNNQQSQNGQQDSDNNSQSEQDKSENIPSDTQMNEIESIAQEASQQRNDVLSKGGAKSGGSNVSKGCINCL